MAITIPSFAEPKVISSLDTYNYTVKQVGDHMVAARMTMANLPSSLSVIIQLNSAPIATSTAPTPGQQVLDIGITVNCAVNDIISFVISSSAQSDSGPNAIKGILSIHRGDSN